ncbi:MAG: DUF2505 family protein [Pseudonocardiaceae bacterium]|nr:DUF2505 family protein [Pseudonocardiaceae bacterium]
MSTQVELRHTYAEAPERVREVLTDPEFLRAKLDKVGGQGAELVSREQDESGAVTVVQRQTVPSDRLPTYAQSLMPGDVVIERTETWTGPGGGPVKAVIKGTPAKITGTMALMPRPHGGGATVTLRIDTKVPIPLFSVAVEKLINENITRLMEREHEFATDWLRDREE